MNKEYVAAQVNRFIQMQIQGANLPDTQAMEVADLYPAWAEGKAYTKDEIVKYGVNQDNETQLWKVVQPHTSQADWTPDKAPSLFSKIGFDPSGVPIWTQPLGAHDAYQTGDVVMHKEQKWCSTCDNNVWEPGVYGWETVDD